MEDRVVQLLHYGALTWDFYEKVGFSLFIENIWESQISLWKLKLFMEFPKLHLSTKSIAVV